MLYPPELRARPSEAPLAGPATRGARIIRKHLKERQFALPEARTAAAARKPHRIRASAASTIPQCTAVRGALCAGGKSAQKPAAALRPEVF